LAASVNDNLFMPFASSPSPSSTAVERAFRILEFLDSTQRAWNISELSRRLELPKSTTHILMRTLARLGYVTHEANSRSFTLALKLSGLGRSVLKNMSLPAIALPFMRSLAQSLRLTVHLAMLEKGQAVYIQKVDGPGLIRFDTYVGKRTNLHCTAVGKLLLAHSADEIKREYLRRATFIRHTQKTIASTSELKTELACIAQRGWAMDDEEEELEVRCLAVPVHDTDDMIVAAIGVAGTVGQVSDDGISSIISQMKNTAALIQTALLD
jgi:IclR family transcriptional regulator, KDG regulon repressor